MSLRLKTKELGFACVASLLLLVVGCDQASPLSSEGPRQSSEVRSAGDSGKLRQHLIEMGFRKDMIVEREKDFVVENDIRFTKAELRRRAARTLEAKQVVLDTVITGDQAIREEADVVVDYDKVSQITYRLDSNLPRSWKAAFRQAATEWENIDQSVVDFSEVSSSGADIVVRYGELGGNIVGLGSWPENGNPGDRIQIDDDYNSYSSRQKKFVAVHELGHNLGFRHTNWSRIGESSAENIPFTPTEDFNSVMNGGTGGYRWNGFSQYDEIASVMLYPVKVGRSGFPGRINDISYESIGNGDYRFTIDFEAPENSARAYIQSNDHFSNGEPEDDDWSGIIVDGRKRRVRGDEPVSTKRSGSQKVCFRVSSGSPFGQFEYVSYEPSHYKCVSP